MKPHATGTAVRSSVDDSRSPHKPRPVRRQRRRQPPGPFSAMGQQWAPLFESMRNWHARGPAATLQRLAQLAELHGGRVHYGWGGLAGKLGVATSTARAHLAQLVALHLVQLVEQGGGRLEGSSGRWVGRANVFEVTERGWHVARGLLPWPQDLPELPAGLQPPPAESAQPGPDTVQTEASAAPPEPLPPAPETPHAPAANVPISGRHLELAPAFRGLSTSPPTPPAVSDAPQGPPASPRPVRGTPDGDPAPAGASNAAAAATPGRRPVVALPWRAEAPPRAVDGRGPLGRRWSASSLERALQREGVPADAIPHAVRRAMGEGVGAPLKLALWWARVEWPKLLQREAAAQAEREAATRREEEERARLRAQLAEEERRTPAPGLRGCPHGGGVTCERCREVGATVAADLVARLTLKPRGRR